MGLTQTLNANPNPKSISWSKFETLSVIFLDFVVEKQNEF